uniref:Uncharacterized protein n=1 Tax=Arundo donax TaxID=35708 RepID=A0A0A9F8R0_ARUDO
MISLVLISKLLPGNKSWLNSTKQKHLIDRECTRPRSNSSIKRYMSIGHLASNGNSLTRSFFAWTPFLHE